ncbi:glutathionylspermidine synthase family protein [Paenibacillus sp. 1001270B_150601_E10]|uniref:glutathionylspermidine synthase family protein n=1 Tax=Paenibacillus sp. 1001270B_150601_E10 TaxID=2787079 RepID=UPI00189DA28B|nr:glutathionylspermidine synthase family protein [Paenibacillus sp. 1001270B_150601_E10]
MASIMNLPYKHDEVFQGEVAARIPYHRMYGKQYCLPSLTVLESHESQAIAEAAYWVDRIYWKVLRFVQRYMPDTFLIEQLGLHPALIDSARIEVPFHGVSRQDWILHEHGLKCIENNTDTPTGIPETAYLAEALVEGYTDYCTASKDMRNHIQQAFRHLIDYYQQQGLDGGIAFTCYDSHLEDLTNTMYLLHAVEELGYPAFFVPLDQLEIIPGEGLYVEGKQISILYRLYPLEYLVHDRDEIHDRPVGEDLLELIMNGKLGIMNPPQSMITQSKGFMALIWSLYEHYEETTRLCGFELFEEKELQRIPLYFLPTYFDPSVFQLSHIPYVEKSYWGREGKGTAIFGGDGILELSEWGAEQEEQADIRDYYTNQPKIYQQHHPMTELELITEEGPYTGSLLLGAYVIGGQYAGLLPRIGGKITGDMAYYCPAAVEKPLP